MFSNQWVSSLSNPRLSACRKAKQWTAAIALADATMKVPPADMRMVKRWINRCSGHEGGVIPLMERVGELPSEIVYSSGQALSIIIPYDFHIFPYVCNDFQGSDHHLHRNAILICLDCKVILRSVGCVQSLEFPFLVVKIVTVSQWIWQRDATSG